MPDAGDMLLILTAGSILGDFHTINLPALTGGLEWLIENDGQNYALEVRVVPLPGALWLLLPALGVLVASRRTVARVLPVVAGSAQRTLR